MLGLALLVGIAVLLNSQPLTGQDKPLQRPQRVDLPLAAVDKSVHYRYDIVYVRAPGTVKDRDGKERLTMVWPGASEPLRFGAGAASKRAVARAGIVFAINNLGQVSARTEPDQWPFRAGHASGRATRGLFP